MRGLVLVLVACLACTGAFARAYVGASAGQSSTEIEPDPSASFDGSGTSFKLQGGYRVIKYFGVEADYRDFGSQDDTVLGEEIELETKSLDLFAVGMLPIGTSWEVFGKAGWSNWDADIRTASGSASDDGTDMAYGLGAAYAFGKFDVRLEYEQFDIEDTDNVSMASLGFNFRF